MPALNSVTISGQMIVGQTLTAVLDPSNATATYQWLVVTEDGGYPIGTDSTLLLIDGYIGLDIEVIATGTGSYTGTVSFYLDPVHAANQNAPRDDNQVPAKLGCLTNDGVSTVRILGTKGFAKWVEASTANTVSKVARKDDNEVNSMLVTSSVDGTTMAVATDGSGNILFKSL